MRRAQIYHCATILSHTAPGESKQPTVISSSSPSIKLGASEVRSLKKESACEIEPQLFRDCLVLIAHVPCTRSPARSRSQSFTPFISSKSTSRGQPQTFCVTRSIKKLKKNGEIKDLSNTRISSDLYSYSTYYPEINFSLFLILLFQYREL